MSECSGAREKGVAILGSGKGSNAGAILEASKSGRLGGRVALVVSDVAGAGILKVAEGYGIPSFVIDPGTSRGGRLSDATLRELLDQLQSHGVELVVCAGFMRILRDPLLSVFAGRILNLHPSLLPKHPGLNSVARALAAGDTETGCTIHLVDAGVDTGEILRQEVVPIRSGDTVESLTARIHEAEHRIYPEVIAERLSSG